MRGFSLLEIVVVVAISAVVFIALGSLMIAFNRQAAYEQSIAQTSGSASAVMREAESLIRSADAIAASHAFSGTTYTSSSTVLVLELPSVDASGAIIDGAYDYAAFYANGGDLYRVLDANPASARLSGTKRLSAAAKALAFTYDAGNSAVTVDVETEAGAGSGATFGDHRTEYLRLRN